MIWKTFQHSQPSKILSNSGNHIFLHVVDSTSIGLVSFSIWMQNEFFLRIFLFFYQEIYNFNLFVYTILFIISWFLRYVVLNLFLFSSDFLKIFHNTVIIIPEIGIMVQQKVREKKRPVLILKQEESKAILFNV